MPQKSAGASCFPTRRASAAGGSKRHAILFPACPARCSISSCPLARRDSLAECSRAAALQVKNCALVAYWGCRCRRLPHFFGRLSHVLENIAENTICPFLRARCGMNNKPVIGDACDGKKKSRPSPLIISSIETAFMASAGNQFMEESAVVGGCINVHYRRMIQCRLKKTSEEARPY
jgi:hypothetical protein